MKPSEYWSSNPAQTSSIGVSRPCSAKNCMRLPANQVKTSSGLPCR